MTEYYKNPKIIFRETKYRDEYTIEYGMAYYDGCFTPTGIRPHMLDEYTNWMKENEIVSKVDTLCCTIRFEKLEDKFWFLMRWQ